MQTCVRALFSPYFKLCIRVCRSGELAQDFEEKKELMMKAQQDTTFTYHKKKGITMEKKEARAQKEEADRYQKLQDDLTKCQLEEQLFRLYHNEREIDFLSDQLKNHQKNLNELVSKIATVHTQLLMYVSYDLYILMYVVHV